MKSNLHAEPCQHEHLSGPPLPPPWGGQRSRCKRSWMPIDNVLAICTLKLTNNVCFAQPQSCGFQSLSSPKLLGKAHRALLAGALRCLAATPPCFPTSSPPLTPPQFPVRAAVITKCFYYLSPVLKEDGILNSRVKNSFSRTDCHFYKRSHLPIHSLKIKLTPLG